MDVISRNNVNIEGHPGGPALLFAHGFGCDQNMWRFLIPHFREQFKIITFDYVGSGKSQLSAYSKNRYSRLEGYAQDIVDIIEALALEQVCVIGHSISSTIASIAASMLTERKIDKLVMVCPSPRFLNDPPDYFGGFEESDLRELLNLMDKNYIGWANYLAPLVMGAGQDSELIGELSGSFCSTDPVIAKTFAEATFFSDYRHLLPEISPETLILQSSHDALASPDIGQYMQRKIPNAHLSLIEAEGHCLHMTDVDKIWPVIRDFLS